jgi:hypothetical protein
MSEILKTNAYNKFKLTNLNRKSIIQGHVKQLAAAMKETNLLPVKPILVNSNFEIVDGQHRFLAAQSIGYPIYYMVAHEITPDHIVQLNNGKNWKQEDYLNFFARQGNPNYLKLEKFMEENRIGVRIALTLIRGRSKKSIQDFMSGRFVFSHDLILGDLIACHRTIEAIEKSHGFCGWARTARFWSALSMLVRHPNFVESKWMQNLNQRISEAIHRASTKEYMAYLERIYNWRNPNPINLEIK